jgi:hypothetical protein
MTLTSKPKYPSRRAYVLKLRSDALPHALTGCVENLVSGRQREFGSAQELLETLVRDLEAIGDGTDEAQDR